ncbi:MAG: N-6 DNA methylase [Pirellulales bacterium]
MAWNPQLPHEWVRLLGLVAISLFGPDRKKAPRGTHTVLLDGVASSLTLSSGDPEELLNSKRAARWAWSSNINHAAIVDASGDKLFWVRSDQPEVVHEHRIADPADAHELLSAFTLDRPKPSDSSVKLALDTFRSLRIQLKESGGTDLDAVRAFNVLLVWADALRTGSVVGSVLPTISEAVNQLNAQGVLRYDVADFSVPAATFPLGFLAGQLLEERRGFPLDPYLLVRHASGTLFQEAHIELDHPATRQRRLFVSLYDETSPPVGLSRRDTRFTPTALARWLTETALARFGELNPSATSVDVLDPACGSGVFLIESARSLAPLQKATLRGIDNSPTSTVIARFAVEQAAKSAEAEGKQIHVDIQDGDSLLPASTWGSPDVILMNPPFLSWRVIDAAMRKNVRTALGTLYVGQSDTAVAFVAKAIATLKPGAVLATLVPGPFLDSRAAARLRSMMAADPGLSIETIGLFRGFKYFANAAVEPAFLLVSRHANQGELAVILAEPGAEDRAIRGARLSRLKADKYGDGFEVSIRRRDTLQDKDWTPRPLRGTETVAQWLSQGVPTVSSLFDVQLGVRVGNKTVLIITAEELSNSGASATEMSFFRPIGDRIRNAHVVPDKLLFYPYQDGQLVLGNEDALARSVPWFYSHKLLPHQKELADRKSLRGRSWWELSEPRLTWMDSRAPRLLTPAFGYFGSFALDLGASYVVVQGSAWQWKQDAGDRDILLAYLAFLNSYEFESLLELLCPKVGGGQYQLYAADLGQVPLPDLAKEARLRDDLSRIGASIARGDGIDPDAVGELVAKSYGLSRLEFRERFSPGELGELQEVFDNLAQRFEADTHHFSKIKTFSSLPAYRQIVGLGLKAVPLILRRLRRKPNQWFPALREITNQNPVAGEARGRLGPMAEAWLAWGRESRHF